MKLISMTAFVLEKSKISVLPLTIKETFKEGSKITNDIFKYANFLNQPLKLEMFVPCDEEGSFLVESLDYDEKLCNYCPLDKKGVYGVDGGYKAGCEGSRCDDARENYNIEYEQAKEKVLFEGFEIYTNKEEEMFILGDYTCLKVSDLENGTIEDLVKYVYIKLTPNAIKRIFG